MAGCGVRPAPVPPTRASLPATGSPTVAAPGGTAAAGVATPSPRSTAAVSAVASSAQPQLGGLELPEEVAWYSTGGREPLAFLLGEQLHRSLLDPRTGEPRLAESWTMAGSRATFSLPASLAWNDGTPLRAADIADLLQQAVESGELVGVEQVRVQGQAVVATLGEPLCPALMRLASWPIVDVREWPPLRASGGATVEAEEEGWRVGPALAYRAYESEAALRAAWEQGEINGILGASRLTMGPLSGPLQRSSIESPLLATLLFRLQAPLVEAATIREALALATDRDALFEGAYGIEPPALLTALLPSGHWAAPDESLTSDPARAAALLSRAGWSDGDGDGVRENGEGEPLALTLTLPLSPDEQWERLGRGLAAQWAGIGVALELQYVPPYALQERLHTERWQIALVTYLVSPDPDQRALWSPPAPDDLVGNDLNVTGYRNAGVSELLTQGATLAGCDPADRASFYHEAWAQIREDRPLWPLFPLPLDAVHRPTVAWPDVRE